MQHGFCKVMCLIALRALNTTITTTDLIAVTLLSCRQILSGMYPISQVQEPYTAVGYLAARVPLVDLLQLVHPLDRSDSDDEGGTAGDENHPWSAWDVCDGKMKP